MEEWKDVKGYEGLYQISNLGRIRSLIGSESRILKPHINGKGYRRIGIYKDGIRKRYDIHRLVAIAFIPNPENKECVDHINTIRTDNRVENLRWVTFKENMNNPETSENCSKGKEGNKKTSKKKCFCIETGEVFESITEAERKMNVNNSSISACCKGRVKSAGKINGIKLHWEYID